jgi:putative nucleotidyltransferase with HDIG domain
MLDCPGLATALRTLDILGVLPYVLPELPELKGVTQSPPHTEDVFSHTISVTQKLDSLLNVLSPEHDQEAEANWGMGMVSLRLGRYRHRISQHVNEALIPDRSVRALLLLAALYHDIAKPRTQQSKPDGRIRFLEHEQVGAQIVGGRAAALHLSNHEIDRLKVVVRNHMRPLLLAQSAGPPTTRAIYRFFRATSQAGVDICLLSLADTLATYGPALPQEVWARHLDVSRNLLEAWWERTEDIVSPPALLSGSELIQEFNIESGPRVGRLIEVLREAQAAGEVHNRAEALACAQAWLQENPYG